MRFDRSFIFLKAQQQGRAKQKDSDSNGRCVHGGNLEHRQQNSWFVEQLAIGIFYYLGAIEVIFFSFRRCCVVPGLWIIAFSGVFAAGVFE